MGRCRMGRLGLERRRLGLTHPTAPATLGAVRAVRAWRMTRSLTTLPRVGERLVRRRRSQRGADRSAWRNRTTKSVGVPSIGAHEQRALTPLFWTHINPYDRFQLDMTTPEPRYKLGVIAGIGIDDVDERASGRYIVQIHGSTQAYRSDGIPDDRRAQRPTLLRIFEIPHCRSPKFPRCRVTW